MENIRNIGFIAHIDAGKTTVTERVLFASGTTHKLGGVDEGTTVTDWIDQERERGITIVSAAATTFWNDCQINIIDTPGHVDFSHEVRRSLMACEGALVIVDASQGVEAQTVANFYLALEHDLEMIPVINKIDLPGADVERVREEIDADLGLDPFEAIPVSAKKGVGIEEVLEGIVQKLPCPSGDPEAPLKALVFDAQYDKYRGVVMLVRVEDGCLLYTSPSPRD